MSASETGDIAQPGRHTRRLLTEQLVQMLSIGTTILDRVLLTAILYRYWGERSFENWSVLASLAGFVGLAEFGFALYFSNAVALSVQRGDKITAVRAFRVGFTVMSLASATGWSIVLGAAFYFMVSGHASTSGAALGYEMAVVALLALGPAVRIPMTVVNALYRAHLRFAHFSVANSIGEAGRILLSVGVVAFLHGGALAVALASLFAVLALQIGYFLRQALRDYPEFSLRPLLPSSDDRREMMSLSTAYFTQTLTTVFLTFLPVLLLDRQTAAASVIASFVLIRTLMGLPRTILQAVGVVIGYECSRHLATRDVRLAMGVLWNGARSISVASGLLSGALLALGYEITRIWLGSRSVYVPSYAAAAALPMVAIAASIVSHNILVSANVPYLAAVGRVVQLALTVLLFFVLPLQDPGLRMFVSLGVGEALGYALLSYISMHRQIPGADLSFHLKIVALSVATFAASYVATNWFSETIGDALFGAWLVKGALAAIFCIAVFVAIGLNASQRKSLLAMLPGRRYKLH